MQILAIANHKGGVGKTALAHNLAYALADAGERVLMVDADPQSSLTSSCAVEAADANLAHVLAGERALAGVVVELLPRLHLAPADILLSHAELTLANRPHGRETVLAAALRPVGASYGACVVDCPPSLGLLTVNALTAADGVLVPVQPQIVDLRGLNLFLQTLADVRGGLNPGLDVVGIVPTFYDGRLLHHQEALQAMAGAGWPVMDVQVGRTVRMAEAATVGQCLLQYDPLNKQAYALTALARRIRQWLRSARR